MEIASSSGVKSKSIASLKFSSACDPVSIQEEKGVLAFSQ
jgi:hypothetical protein